MTENEAIKEFQQNIDMPFGSNISREASELAIQALEKKIPKKVRYEDVGYEQYGNVNVYACICPSCDLEIIKFDDNDVSKKCESDDVEKMFHSSMVHHAYIGLNNYCNRCGQKLDWSD
jgi:hypothetical protein